MEATLVLVLSTDPLGAALVAMLVEAEGGVAAFAHPGELARDAVRRVRPRVVLVDCDYPGGCEPALVGPATMMGTGVVLLAPPRRADEVARCAERLGVGLLRLPPEPGELRAALAAASAAAHRE